MTVLESLIVANLALLSFLLHNIDLHTSSFYIAMTIVSSIFPILGLAIYLGNLLLKKLCPKVYQKILISFKPLIHCCFKNNQLENGEQGYVNNHEELPLPDRVVHPQLYALCEDTSAV